MLTSNLVRARAQGRELRVSRLTGKQRTRAVELAEILLGVVRDCIGVSREEVKEAVCAVEVGPNERKLFDGLVKLVDDACEYADQSEIDPVELRRDVFLLAAHTRRGLRDASDFDRARVLHSIAEQKGQSAAVIERALFSDLKGAHLLLRLGPLEPEGLVQHYERAQVQAVLLRAVSVVARVRCASASTMRALFRKLKFHRLLHEVHELPGGELQISIDGPYSLFGSVTKYGLELALLLPALEECDRLELSADVRWGKRRQELTFRYEHVRPQATGALGVDELPVEVKALLESFAAMDTRWQVAVANKVLELPGVGLCVPDLVFTHPEGSSPVYLEVLGYWSRDALWKRVELVEQGLPERVLFAASARLRVSEAVLEDCESGALYVYKGTMSPRAIERRLDGLRV